MITEEQIQEMINGTCTLLKWMKESQDSDFLEAIKEGLVFLGTVLYFQKANDFNGLQSLYQTYLEKSAPLVAELLGN